MGLKDERFVNVRAFPFLLLPFASSTHTILSTLQPLCAFVLHTDTDSAAVQASDNTHMLRMRVSLRHLRTDHDKKVYQM